MHISIPTLPFGGVGESGMGCYHGRSSFEAFVHRRSITTTPSWVERVLAMRYPPYSGKLGKLLGVGTLKPNFDRTGREKLSLLNWMVWIVTLGGGANKSGAARTTAAALGKYCSFPPFTRFDLACSWLLASFALLVCQLLIL